MKCEIIKDLLPSYVDGLTSEESNREIELHLENCEECHTYLEEMKKSIKTPKVELEDKFFIQILKKIRKIEIEKKVLVLAIIAIFVVFLYDGVYKYFYGIYDVEHKEVRISCEVNDSKRTLIFEPKDDKWIVSVGYCGYSNHDEVLTLNGKEPNQSLSLTKSRKEHIQGVLKNEYTIEFLDEDTYIDSSESEEMKYVDFDQNDFIQIDFGTEKRMIKLSDLYEGNIKSLK